MEKEKKDLPLLAICIPTRNGGDTIVNNVVNILKNEDKRFIIHVNNNCSTDDTLNRLELIASKDDRLKITSNEACVPAYVNFNEVLTKAVAKYIYIIIDKETLDPNFLSNYLNMLETVKPFFGRVIYNQNKEQGVLLETKGVNAIKSISHFGNTHTTGFFYRKDLYLNEIDYLLQYTNGGNWWITDLVSLCLGFQYDGINYNIPLNVFNYQAVLGGVSKSKFTKENLYFYGKQRCVDYEMFLGLILHKDNSKGVVPIINALNDRYINLVTYDQRRYFQDKQRCSHYGVDTRKVTYKEMVYWCRELKKILINKCDSYGLKAPKLTFTIITIRTLVKSVVFRHRFVLEFTLKMWSLYKSLILGIHSLFRGKKQI